MALDINKVNGVVVVPPDYKSGISTNDYEWRKSTMVLDIDGSNGKTDLLSVVGFMRIADIMKDMSLNKGDRVSVSLSVKSRKWKDNYYTDVYVNEIRFEGRNFNDTDGVLGDTTENSKEHVFVFDDGDDGLPF